MRSEPGRSLRILTAGAIAALAVPWGQPARAAGGMDPGYQEILAESERAAGRVVDWTVRLVRVEKRYYTYTMTGIYLADPGEEPCDGCRLIIVFRARPEETARPARFKPRQVVMLRGTILRLDPYPVLLAMQIRAAN